MYATNVKTFDHSVALNGTASTVDFLDGLQPTGLILPTAFEATTVKILFKVGMTATVDYLREEDGTLVAVTVAAVNTNTRVVLPPAKFHTGWKYIQLELADATNTAVAQATLARTITLIAGKVI